MNKVLPLRRFLRRRGKKCPKRKRLKKKTGTDFTLWLYWLSESVSRIIEAEEIDQPEKKDDYKWEAKILLMNLDVEPRKQLRLLRE